MKILSVMRSAAMSQGRTPMKANFPPPFFAGGSISKPLGPRRAEPILSIDGKRNFFHECGPTVWPK
jgi:hypothetical protein